jgi:hypothetical protein
MRYYDLRRHWTRHIEPHLADKHLNTILVRDFNKFTFGRWRKPFMPGRYPWEFESCYWSEGHRGPAPRFWRYVKHAACHWLVNFALRLANLAVPTRPWRIITSDRHSTVWDGRRTLFDFNYQAFGIDAQTCFEAANGRHLPVGKHLKVYYAQHYTEER